MTFDPQDIAFKMTSDHFDTMFHDQFGTRNYRINEGSMDMLGGLVDIYVYKVFSNPGFSFSNNGNG